jgi:hypothetical protein
MRCVMMMQSPTATALMPAMKQLPLLLSPASWRPWNQQLQNLQQVQQLPARQHCVKQQLPQMQRISTVH